MGEVKGAVREGKRSFRKSVHRKSKHEKKTGWDSRAFDETGA